MESALYTEEYCTKVVVSWLGDPQVLAAQIVNAQLGGVLPF